MAWLLKTSNVTAMAERRREEMKAAKSEGVAQYATRLSRRGGVAAAQSKKW